MDKAAICIRIESRPQTHYHSAGGPTNVLKNNKQSNYFFDLLRTSAQVWTMATSTNTIAILRCRPRRYFCPCVPKSGNMLMTIDKINGRARKTISQKVTFWASAEHLQVGWTPELPAAVTS